MSNSKRQAISIVVPTLNEEENISPLLSIINNSLGAADITYEVLIIDDHSLDSTVETANSLASTYPVRVLLKEGKRGKAYSLLEGFSQTKYPLVAMIDADLQYPPEELVSMHNLITESNADIIVTNRKEKKTNFLRKLSAKIYNFLFVRLLFGIAYDTQSGLKLFRKSILNSFELSPSPWSFDLEFLIRSIEHEYKILSHDIPFNERKSGVTKVKILSTSFELALASLKLRLNTSVHQMRVGNRANQAFIRKVFLRTLLVSLMLAAPLHLLTAKASALAPAHTENSKLSQVTSVLTGIEDNAFGAFATPPTTKPTSTTSSVTPSVAPSNADQNSVVSTDSKTAVQPSSNSSSVSQSTTKNVGSSALKAGSSSGSAALKDSAARTKPLKIGQNEDYSTLIYNPLSPKDADTLRIIAALAVAGGAVCLAIAYSTYFINGHRFRLKQG